MSTREYLVLLLGLSIMLGGAMIKPSDSPPPMVRCVAPA